MRYARLAMVAVVLCAVVLPGAAQATTYTYVGPVGDSNWSNTSNWTGGGAGEYPDDITDIGRLNVANKNISYDAASSGVVGGMQIAGRLDSQYITIARDTLVDYTGNTGSTLTPAGWIYMRMDDSSTTGYRIASGKTLTITGFKGEGADSNDWSWSEGGTLKFRPDAGGKGYLYMGNVTVPRFFEMDVDLRDLSVLEVANVGGTGKVAGNLTIVDYAAMTSGAATKLLIGRTDASTQRLSAPPGVSGTSGRVIESYAYYGHGNYAPKVVVSASGASDASPNLIIMEKEAIGGFTFPDTATSGAGGWIESAGAGVARLVLEGNFTTADNSNTAAVWNMSRIQLQMAGEQAASQELRWCAENRNNPADPNDLLTNFTGFTNNYAVRKLVIGSDEGTGANHVNFTTTANGAALYAWGLEFITGGYLNIVNANDYVYYLGDMETVGGVAGMGLTLDGRIMNPALLSTYTNRPENIILLGQTTPFGVLPEPAALSLLGLALLAARKRRK
jgi:hypothetical protein